MGRAHHSADNLPFPDGQIYGESVVTEGNHNVVPKKTLRATIGPNIANVPPERVLRETLSK